MCRRIERRREFGIESATGEIEYVADLQFLASPDAAAAKDAFFIVPHDERVAVVKRIAATFPVEAHFFNAKLCGKLL